MLESTTMAKTLKGTEQVDGRKEGSESELLEMVAESQEKPVKEDE